MIWMMCDVLKVDHTTADTSPQLPPLRFDCWKKDDKDKANGLCHHPLTRSCKRDKVSNHSQHDLTSFFKDPGCWSGRVLNPWPSARQTGALLTELTGQRQLSLSFLWWPQLYIELIISDYDAPLSEAGDITPKYKALRNVLRQYDPNHSCKCPVTFMSLLIAVSPI